MSGSASLGQSAGREYRVRWQREGRQRVSRIFQTEAAAHRKIEAILALDEIKGDIPRWEDMPDLIGPPELQVREVGEWLSVQASTAPSEAARKGVAAWAGVHDDYEGVF